MAPAERIKSA
jgi:hypothetical protein